MDDNVNATRQADNDQDWEEIASYWSLREGTTYLNHGSFGPPPNPVRRDRQSWSDKLDEQPMDFFARQHESALIHARDVLAEFVGTSSHNLAFVENATFAMNVVAESFELDSGDQVLLNNHEYGAVHRIWNRRCEATGAECRVAKLPRILSTQQSIVDAIFDQVTERTKLIIVSHITSPTAVTMPVEMIIDAAHKKGIQVCVDGPHALVQLPVHLDRLSCDYYTASCHKWLSAPFGSGFLFTHPRHQESQRPLLQSWGRLLPNVPESWCEHFQWTGSRDSSPYFTVPTAIQFINSIGLDAFRDRTHYLASQARTQLEELTGLSALIPDSPEWYVSMTEVPLPPGDHSNLQKQLWSQFGIEIPIIHFEDEWFIRVSCHLYTNRQHLDYLLRSLKSLL